LSEYESKVNELFEKKDFSSIFYYSKPDYIINVILSLKREHFTDVKHYMMFEKYVKPKLKLIGKAYAKRMFLSRYRYLYYYTCEIVVTRSYIVFKFVRYRYRLGFSDNGYGYYMNTVDFSGEHIDTYLLGFNSDGKLFVNKIPLSVIDYRSSDIEGYDIYHSYGVIVVRAKDSLVHQALGYNHDCNDSEKIVVVNSGAYRVQGEIVLNALKVDYSDISDAIGVETPVGIVHNEIYDYIQRYVANDIMVALVNLGFNVEYVRSLNANGITYRHSIVIPNVVSSRISNIEARFYRELIMKGLWRTLKDYAMLFNRENNTLVIANELITAIIDVDIVRTENDGRYSSIVVAPLRIDVEKSKLFNMLFNELKEAMRNIKRQNYTVALGNHIINIKNAVALNVEYTPSIRPKIPMLSDWTIRFNLGYYYVDNQSSVEIQHHEHGRVEIEFNGQYLIEFRTTNVDSDHIREWNRAVLASLALM
jgi:hypothetical protein